MKAQQNISIHTFHTPFGKISGLRENGVIRARSIRYAYSERFRKPVPVASADSEEVSGKIPVCPQNISPLLERLIGKADLERYEVNESTQFLTITRPETINENDELPVVVWIHGGSYEIGCGDLSTSDPSVWVKEQNIIVVSVSYRLGVFGFLGGNEERPANLGLFDIIEALKWIKNNIRSFGGNPDNVTLFGQSSGGDAVTHLMIADGIENLFHRVIVHSAPLGFRHKRQKMSAQLLRRTDVLKRETDVMKLTEAYVKFLPSVMRYGLKASMPFCLQYGYPPLCTEEESVRKWENNAGKYDVLMGWNNEETAFYVKTSEKMNKYFGSRILDKIVDITTESIYGKPAKTFSRSYARAGGNIYLFRLHSGWKNHIGAAHCIDLPLIFENEAAWRSSELIKDIPWEYIHENGKRLRALWAEFARDGKIDESSERPEILELRKI
ncbi:carboxylesterase family protein [Chryseobacterium gossypii]|uniref:carboxylesterase family protein n=1 Tax=Chryseobacterium gossypii TaxID=3231602 RepID=UPI0035266280